MRTYFYTLIILLAVTICNAQNVPNGDFEAWTSHGTFSYPDFWKTTDSISMKLTFQHSATQETNLANVYHGASAIKMVSWNAGFFIAPGAATNGDLNTNTFLFEGGSADTIRHDVLTGYYKYTSVSNDTC